ncbi:PEGA domain-containing protein [Saltatorellus ferox]
MGEHTVRLWLPGYEAHEQSVRVREGKRRWVRATITPTG